MRRLSGVDSAFIYGETPTWHMHVCSLIIADPGDMEGGFDVDRLKRQLVELKMKEQQILDHYGPKHPQRKHVEQ